MIKIVSEAPAEALPELARAPLSGFIDDVAQINWQLADIAKRLQARNKGNAQSKRLKTVPGVGLIGATALCALVPDPKLFRNGRHFSAWIGITPRLDGTGQRSTLAVRPPRNAVLTAASTAPDFFAAHALAAAFACCAASAGRKAAPLAMTAQAMRASLLASATVTARLERLESSP